MFIQEIELDCIASFRLMCVCVCCLTNCFRYVCHSVFWALLWNSEIGINSCI